MHGSYSQLDSVRIMLLFFHLTISELVHHEGSYFSYITSPIARQKVLPFLRGPPISPIRWLV